MKPTHLLILALTLLGSHPGHSTAAAEGDPFSSYVLLYSSNVAGETEPCG